MFEVERQSKEIYDLMNWAQEGVDQGTRYPDMSYEQGILDALHVARPGPPITILWTVKLNKGLIV